MATYLKDLTVLKNGDIKVVAIVNDVEQRFLTNVEQIATWRDPSPPEPMLAIMPALAAEYKKQVATGAKVETAAAVVMALATLQQVGIGDGR